jgi:hypothetical protein
VRSPSAARSAGQMARNHAASTAVGRMAGRDRSQGALMRHGGQPATMLCPAMLWATIWG